MNSNLICDWLHAQICYNDMEKMPDFYKAYKKKMQIMTIIMLSTIQF